jgi:hypothetical protein
MERAKKKEDLINRKNPQWNVLVTEHGFVRKPSSFTLNEITFGEIASLSSSLCSE